MGLFSLIFRLGVDKREFDRGMQDSVRTAKRASQQMGDAFSQGGIRQQLGGIGELIGGIVGVAQVKGLIDFAQRFQDISERTGVAVSTLQELDYALKQTGSSIEQAEKAFKALGQARQKALADPAGKEAAKFKVFGIDATELARLRDGGALFLRLSDAIAKTRLDANSLPVILDLIGTKNSEVIPAMAAGLGQAANEARRLGLILDDEVIASLDDIGDEIERQALAIKKPFAEIVLFFTKAIDATIQAVRAIGASLIGAFGEMMQMNPFLGKENKEFWKDTGKFAADDFMKGFQEFLDRNDPEKKEIVARAKRDRAGKANAFNIEDLIAGEKPKAAPVPQTKVGDALLSVGNFLGSAPDSRLANELKMSNDLLRRIEAILQRQTNNVVRFE